MNSQDQTKNPEKISAKEQEAPVNPEKILETVGKKELTKEETDAIKEELRREIEAMDKDPALKKEAEDKARKIGSLAIDEIIANLLEITQQRNVVFAFNVAYKMNDPYILDTFRDLLAREGYFKKFMK